MTWNEFYNKLISANTPHDTNIKIKGQDHELVFVASYYTEHYPDDEYLKVFFRDDTVLQVVPDTKELFFCDDERRNIDRGMIHDDRLVIDGKEYILQNGDDKQFVKKIYFGDLSDGEGECIFSDYAFQDEVWSLAVLDNGEVSDIHVKAIELKDIG